MKWKSKDGREIEISQMDNIHLLNATRMLRENGHTTDVEYHTVRRTSTEYDPSVCSRNTLSELETIKIMGFVGNGTFEALVEEISKRGLVEYPTRCSDPE